MKKLLILLLAAVPALAYADPISAIAAIGTMAASGGIGALAAGGLAALSLTQGLALAGGAMGLVGAVSGNKKLKTLGGILGIASLATGVINAANAGPAAAGEAAGEAAKSAGADALAQTAATPAAEIAADVATADMDAINAALEPSKQIAEVAKTASGGTSAGGSALGGVGKFIKDNKELVNMGGGLIKGAMEGYAADARQKDMVDEEKRRLAAYNSSITGVSPVGQMVNPDANVTAGRPVQNVTRYTAPRKGLIRAAQQQGG